MKKFLFLAFLVVVLDQITKFLFTDVHFGVFNYVKNTGAAFSLFQGYVGTLSIISLLVVIFIVYLFRKNKEYLVPLAFVLGGTVGNFIDRVFLGYVRDFIDLTIWPVFNVADSFNVIGVGIMVYYLIKEKKDL
jgi:signal peptidase II